MRELRANLRAVVEKVEAGTPVVCLKDGQPLAVMISHEEAERWRKIEDSLAASTPWASIPKPWPTPPSSPISPRSSRPTSPPSEGSRRSHGRSSRRYGRSASRMPGPPSPPWSARWPRAASERSSPRSSRRRCHPGAGIRPTPRPRPSGQLVPRRRAGPGHCDGATGHRLRPHPPRADQRRAAAISGVSEIRRPAEPAEPPPRRPCACRPQGRSLRSPCREGQRQFDRAARANGERRRPRWFERA